MTVAAPTMSMFDEVLAPPDFSASRYDIRPVNDVTATRWYAQHHYLETPPGSATHWGIFAPDLMAIVSIGEPNNVFGIAGKYGLEAFPGNKEVSRVAKHPECRIETSKLMWLAIREAAKVRGWDWVFSYADTGQGHHGGIYQAIGAVYVGVSEARAGWVRQRACACGPCQTNPVIGASIHPRTAVATLGSQAKATMNDHGYDAVEGLITAKHVYIIPVGPRAAQVRTALAPLTKPYPKREAT